MGCLCWYPWLPMPGLWAGLVVSSLPGFWACFYLVGLLVGLYVGIVIGLAILCSGCGLGFIWLVACWLRVIFVLG